MESCLHDVREQRQDGILSPRIPWPQVSNLRVIDKMESCLHDVRRRMQAGLDRPTSGNRAAVLGRHGDRPAGVVVEFTRQSPGVDLHLFR